MNRVSILTIEKQSLINRLNNHKSLLEKAINEKIKSIDLILDSL